ncbi:MAG: hypothetical protein WCF77_04095 [Minisyncoccia bacterium]|jgi:hypothetical protein
MDRTKKQIIAVIVSLCVLGVAVYGSYFPMRKAEIFISTLQGLSASPVTSLTELQQRLSVPLDYPSPIGQEELVRNTANNILSFVSQGGDATSTAFLISFINSYYGPIIARGTGMSFGQDLYLMGALNETAYAHTGNPAYIEAAQKYYEEGATLGPNRPQSLYGLFDIYRAEGNVASTTAIAERILTNWPSDTSVKQGLQSFLNAASSAAAAAAAAKK